MNMLCNKGDVFVKERIEPFEASVQGEKKDIPYHALIQTQEFRELIKRKKAFILPTTIFFLIFYFTLPLLAAYTKILHTEVIRLYCRGMGICHAYNSYLFGLVAGFI